MNFFAILGTVIQAWVAAGRCLRYGRVREPLFLLCGLQLSLLVLFGQFHFAWIAGAMTPIVRFLGGEAATHYPEHFWRMPEIYRSANAVLMIGFGTFAHAAAIAGFAAREERWRPAFRRAPILVPIAVLTTGAAWGITSAFNLVPVEIALRSSIIRLGLQAVELGLIALVYSLFAFAPVLAMLEDNSLGRALGGSLRLARQFPLHVLLLIATPMAILFPPSFFLFEMNLDEAGLAPEAVGLLLTGLLVIRVLFDALVLGGLTALFFRYRRGGR